VTLSSAQFLERFPEFDRASPDLIAARLAEAYRRTPDRIWGDLADDGAGYLAAHLLALSPFAAELKLVGKERTTIYGDERGRLERIVSAGFRVTGEP
jgi:hypothetical protein